MMKSEFSPAERLVFSDKRGVQCNGIAPQALADIRRRVGAEFGISPLQMSECAGFSMAMVVRFALGLSAEGGAVSLLLRESLGSQVALAAARHLMNAGTSISLFMLEPAGALSTLSGELLRPLRAAGVDLKTVSGTKDLASVKSAVSKSHNVIFGLTALEEGDFELREPLTNMLNNIRTPVHAIEGPSGIDLETGALIGTPLVASSTLSLGVPLLGLRAGHEYVGRHYLGDISLPRTIYESIGCRNPALFAEQPVIQIFPVQPESKGAQ